MAIIDLAARKKKATDLSFYREDRFILCPKHWTGYKNPASLTWTSVRFTEANATSVPDNKMGIYSFVAIPGIAQHPACHYLLYIGMVATSDFRTRYRSYLKERTKSKPRDHIVMMLERWQKHLWFYYAEVSGKAIIEALEDDLIVAYLPPVNREWPASIGPVMRMAFS
jgi:hypothetical protein